MKGAGIEFTKSDLEPSATDLLRQVTGDPAVEHCPEGKSLAEWPPCHSAKKKRRGMLGFDDERFQSARGDNAEVRVGHIDPNSTTAAAKSRTLSAFIRHEVKVESRVVLEFQAAFPAIAFSPHSDIGRQKSQHVEVGGEFARLPNPAVLGFQRRAATGLRVDVDEPLMTNAVHCVCQRLGPARAESDGRRLQLDRRRGSEARQVIRRSLARPCLEAGGAAEPVAAVHNAMRNATGSLESPAWKA